MAEKLSDTIFLKSPDQLYDMVESGWNATVARVELARRSLPATRPPSRSKRRRGSLHAKRRQRPSGGFVDHSTISDPSLVKQSQQV